MKVVYAKVTATVGTSLVRGGSHWPADDPVVHTQPSLFSEDPRYGLSYSVEPAEFREETAVVREKRSYVRRT